MRAIKTAISLTLLFILLSSLFLMPVADAQEPSERKDQANNINALGLADPAPSGFSVLYMFTGVANDITDDDQVATTIHCTNFGTTGAQVEIQLFDHNISNVFTTGLTIDSNNTKTVSTQNTFYREDFTMNTGFIEQGSGRVLANHLNLICTTQVLQPIEPSTPYTIPLFMVTLPMFDSNGNLVSGGQREIYLPTILKDN